MNTRNSRRDFEKVYPGGIRRNIGARLYEAEAEMEVGLLIT
jgi:hypothetical protein